MKDDNPARLRAENNRLRGAVRYLRAAITLQTIVLLTASTVAAWWLLTR